MFDKCSHKIQDSAWLVGGKGGGNWLEKEGEGERNSQAEKCMSSSSLVPRVLLLTTLCAQHRVCSYVHRGEGVGKGLS